MFEELKKLSREQDNWVAGAAYHLLTTDYPDTPSGFRRAISDACEKTSSLVAFAKESGQPSLSFESHPDLVYRPAYRYPHGYNRLLNQAGIASQVWPGEIMGVPNRPGPLATMLVLGLLGAGAGRLTGHGLNRLADGHLPGLPNRMTAYGAAAGIIPGVLSAVANAGAGKHPLFGDALAVPMQKSSFFNQRPPQMIPVEAVHDMVWNDPNVARRLPPSLAAATSAVVEGASRMDNKQTAVPFITPMDVGRMAVGMGSGYASGLIAGKAMGALFGVSDQAQKTLRTSGVAAGLLRSVIPIVFGG